MTELFDRVWEYSQNNPHGFTLNLVTMQPIKLGICVGYFETQNSFGPEGLKIALQHALKHQKIIGGWLSDKGAYYFDSVRIFRNSELPQAIEFAKANKQLAIFDLTNLREIRID